MCRYTYTECTEHLTGMSPMAVIRVVFVAFVCMLVYSYVWTCSAEHPRDMWQMTSSHIAVCLRVWASVCEGVCPAYSLLIMFITCTIPDGAFMYLCISVWPYFYMYVCMYACMYVCIHACKRYVWMRLWMSSCTYNAGHQTIQNEALRFRLSKLWSLSVLCLQKLQLRLGHVTKCLRNLHLCIS